MVVNINLLPSDLKPKSQFLKLSKVLNKIAKIVGVVVLVTTMVAAGVFFVLQSRIKESEKKQNELKVKVKALEETEQRLFLLKDRLGKIKQVLGEESAQEELVIYTDVLSMLPTESSYGESALNQENVNFSVSVADSDNLAQLISNLVNQGNFQKINISSLQLDSGGGYTLGLILSR